MLANPNAALRGQDLTFWGDGGRAQENRTFIISLARKHLKSDWCV